jgi:hypothetical protein
MHVWLEQSRSRRKKKESGSTDGLLGKGARILLKKLSTLLAARKRATGRNPPLKKFADSLSMLVASSAIRIAIVRATHLCRRRSRIPTSKMSKRLNAMRGEYSRPRPLHHRTVGGMDVMTSRCFERRMRRCESVLREWRSLDDRR